MHELSADLRDLVESVRAIELDPYRFGIELDEVQRRRGLVDDVGREIEDMREELKRTVERPAAQGTLGRLSTGEAGGGGPGGEGAGGGGLPSPSHFDGLLDEERDGDYYEGMEQQRQVEMMEEQDQQLDGVFRTVGNLRQQADDMGRELGEQSEMLKDVDTLADRVGGKLQQGARRIGHVIRKNEGMCRTRTCCSDLCVCTKAKQEFYYDTIAKLIATDTMSSCCIAVLIMALILLLVLVIVL